MNKPITLKPYTVRVRMVYSALLNSALALVTPWAAVYGVSESLMDGEMYNMAILSAHCDNLPFPAWSPQMAEGEMRDCFDRYMDVMAVETVAAIQEQVAHQLNGGVPGEKKATTPETSSTGSADG